MAIDGSPLSPQVCKQHAEECRLLAQQAGVEAVRIMLEHVASTWDRIAEKVANSDED